MHYHHQPKKLPPLSKLLLREPGRRGKRSWQEIKAAVILAIGGPDK